MCCFTATLPADAVSNTHIFARATDERQFLVYGMDLTVGQELAMVLPLPVPPSSGEDAVRFIDLAAYPDFFLDLRKGFPYQELTLAPNVAPAAAGGPRLLKVHHVGHFEASFVPTIADFARLEARFRLPWPVWEELPHYRDYGFAVFKLRDGARGLARRTIHPMAFEFPRREPRRLFFPTVHVHDGRVHPDARFDHTLYCQVDPHQHDALGAWQPSPRPARQFMDMARAGELIDGDAPCHRVTLRGTQKNVDTFIDLPAPPPEHGLEPRPAAPPASRSKLAPPAPPPRPAKPEPTPPKIERCEARAVDGDASERRAAPSNAEHVKVYVQRHRLKTGSHVLSCRTYLSDGLAAVGQREIVFTLLEKAENEPDLSTPSDLFAHLHRMASAGHYVEAGDVTQFAAPGFPSGDSDFLGVVYTHALPLPEVPLPEAPALAAIALTRDELETAKAFGACRVLARLARFQRYFPCPPWADRRRRSLVSIGSMQPTRLDDVARVLVRGSAVLEGPVVRIRLQSSASGPLQTALAARAPSPLPVALLLQMDAESDACLAWKPGLGAIETIAAVGGGARVSGTFLLLEERTEDALDIVEDGFVLGMTQGSWKSLTEALAETRRLEGPELAPLRWSLEWRADPLEAQRRPAPTDAPASHPVPSGASHLRQVVMLSSEADNARAVRADRLTDYIAAAKQIVESYFAGATPDEGHELSAAFELPPSLRVQVQLQARPALPREDLDELAERLRGLPPPLVRHCSVRFELRYALWGGTTRAVESDRLPAAPPSEVATPLVGEGARDFVQGQLAEAEMLVEYGLPERAAALLQHVLSRVPDDPQARAALDQLRVHLAPSSSETPTDERLATAPASRRSTITWAAGEHVAERFRVVRFLARGGMGEVYEVYDEVLGERVALKTIRPEVAVEEDSLARFKREISLARKIAHPNVCRIYEFGFHQPARGPRTAFFTMELLVGSTLSARIARGAVPIAEAGSIVRQMCAGLDAAHRSGVVHRDFKSANVLLVAETDGTRAVVTDFGLARVAGRSTTTTQTGIVLGTPAYMAPEQVEGGPITPAADIYALGIVLYEMVTGRTPFEGATGMVVALQRLREPPRPPRALVPDLDPKWESAILRCLEREPPRRFRAALDVSRALGLEPT
jgi:hypothetical protein